ncbi:putative mitochondrial ribosomal protein [Pseudozyma hubeiensis]|nr:putative mitochondrial ribosomal protein [Pseudozyma hubeiensis]
MISAQSSQALIARTAFRGATTTVASRATAAASQLARNASALLASNSASFQQSSRSFAVSTVSRQAVETSIPTPASDADPTFASAQRELPTSGRKKRGAKPSTDADKAKLLLKWGWFEPGALEIQQLLDGFRRSNTFPDWLRRTYEDVKSFRSARSRLWSPTTEEIRTLVGQEATVRDPQEWINRQIKTYRKTLEAADAKVSGATKALPEYVSQADLWDMMDYEQQVDFALRGVWKSMSQEQRATALLRSRFDSIRKLGWRQGYSSGYPRPQQDGESSHLPDKLGARDEEGWAAFRTLQQAEEQEAWAAWQQLSPEERVAEEKAAWKLRDRSQVYLDDSEDSLVLASPSPRWYSVPERAGELTFLPNTIIKLVKNHTPEGTDYDAFKATFRVPLSMHKHALRSYLLSIYGLKTTWARSSIYRSPVTRDNRTGKVISGRGRTYKKVEVGLLEPFLFPEISPDFAKQHLLTSELDYERSRVYLKMTKTTRWRGKKSTEQFEQEIANRDRGMYHQLDALASEGIVGEAKKEAERFPRFMVKTKGLPSAKHGKILELLAEERKVKERRVEELVQQFKRDAAKAAEGSSEAA